MISKNLCDKVSFVISLIKVLEETESDYNGRIKVVKTFEGTRILVGGITQSGWLLKKVWEAGVKKIKKEKPTVETILILGLGGGTLAELAERYWPESKVTGVDIDAEMVRMGRKHLGLDRVKNLEIHISDAIKWLKGNKKKEFDIILIDLYQGTEIPPEFRTENFIKMVKARAAKNGIVAFNHLYSHADREDANDFEKKLKDIFPSRTSVKPEANIIFICYT